MTKFELEPYNRNVPDDDLVDDLKRVVEIVGKVTITRDEYQNNGRFSRNTIERRFGTWNKALEVAKLNKTLVRDITDEKLFENIENVWIKLGRQPRYLEMRQPLSVCSIQPYQRRFGTWRKALEIFVEFINSAEQEDNEEAEEKHIEIIVKVNHKTKRQLSLTQRFLIFKRDNFKCCVCGRSPATDPTVILHADHIKPWTKGGETTIENLQTLCSVCNIGKSNLD
jgi:predicted restriction endonuclease